MTIDRNLKTLATRLQPLGHPIRLSILARLSKTSGECVCDLALALSLEQPRISHHLAILRNARLVKAHREGPRVVYRILPRTALAVLDGVRGLFESSRSQEEDA